MRFVLPSLSSLPLLSILCVLRGGAGSTVLSEAAHRLRALDEPPHAALLLCMRGGEREREGEREGARRGEKEGERSRDGQRGGAWGSALRLRAGEAPPAWQLRLQAAMDSQGKGEMAEAARLYREAMELHPPLQGAWPVLTNYGLSVQPAQPDAAVRAFRAVVRLVPDGADGYFNLANALVDVGELEQAVGAFEACLAIAPEDADAHYNLGAALLGARQPERALSALHAAARLAPADGKAHLGLADCLMRLGQVEEAETSYARARELRPAHAPTLAASGNCAEERGDLAAAEALWKRALALEEDDAVYANMGAMLRRANRLPESRAAYAAAVRLNPRNAEAYIGLGKCYRAPAKEAGTLAQRRAYAQYLASTYGQAIRIAPEHVGAHLAVAEGLAMWGERGACDELGGKSALDFYAEALRLQPQNTNAATHVAYDAAATEAESAPATFALSPAELAAPHATTLVELSVDLPPAGAPESAWESARKQAMHLWRAHGAVVFPRLLTLEEVAPLLAAVRAAEQDANATDYTQVTRGSALGARTHKALPVCEAKGALEAIVARIGPFLHTALGGGSEEPLPLMESGFMVTRPGAKEQAFHRDVAPGVVSCSSLSASLQVALEDTAANQGALQLKPGTHVFDPSAPFADGMDGADMPEVTLALPAGSVVIYALHLIHRGSANSAAADRPFYFFTLKGRGYAPPGLAYTIRPEDIAQWKLPREGGFVKV